jgi:peroxiredoxin Q/BCP
MLEEGQPAPAFRVADQDGREISLAQFKGKFVVLYFYPKDNTPGCTIEACGFRDESSAIEKRGAVVLGVSADSSASHRKFADGHKLPFPLLADVDRSLSKAYGVLKEKSMFGKKFMGIERSTVIIDREGVVRKIFRKVRVLGHVQKVLQALDTL